MARRTHSAPDDPDVTGTDRGTGVLGHGPARDWTTVHSNSALRTERNAAYSANVNAIYEQYAIDQGHARVEQLERETVTPAMHRVEAEDPEPHPEGLDDRLKGNGRLAEADNLKRGETRQAPDDTTAVAWGGSALADHDGRMRDVTIPGTRSGEYHVVPHTPALVHECDLPEGYKSSPALKRDPYHPDSVAVRSAANQELYAATSRDRAAALGYTTRIPAQKAPFDSHGQEVFTNGKSYISPDVDAHNVTNGWKMFSRRGARIGTYDLELNYVKE
jgi:hypothetical protein